MRELRSIRKSAVLGLALLLVAGCGQGATPTATLEVASVPAANIYVDGVSQGTSPATLALTEGDHKIELRSDKFASFETAVTLSANESKKIDAALVALDPSDPLVIEKLSQAQGVDVAPFVAPEITRGRSGERAAAVLLWPSRDVRKAGLVSYAIEADETYAGDATLEFRHGRTVLYREAFTPETVTTVRSIPAEVLEAVEVGRKITWGLYYEDSRPAIKTSFRIVNRRKADTQMAKLEQSRHVARQPKITQDLMKAAVLENNRLYTEALVLNLQIAANHPNSTQPYRGIVTTLRRLDAENSELWAFVAPAVAGKGGHASAGGGARGGAEASMGINAWMPKQSFGGITGPKTERGMDVSGANKGPGGAGVTPPATTDQPGTAPAPESAAPGESVAGGASVTDKMKANIEAQERVAAEMQGKADEAKSVSDETSKTANEANEAAEAAESAASEAEAAANAAREAVEQANPPTDEQVADMTSKAEAAAQAREAAQAARTAADQARHAADEAARAAVEAEAAAAQQAQRVGELKSALENAAGVPVPTPNDGTVDTGAIEAQAGAESVAHAQERSEAAKVAYDAAKSALSTAQDAAVQNPTEENQAAVAEAQEAFDAAAREAYEAQEQLEAAQRAALAIGNQVQKPAVK